MGYDDVERNIRTLRRFVDGDVAAVVELELAHAVAAKLAFVLGEDPPPLGERDVHERGVRVEAVEEHRLRDQRRLERRLRGGGGRQAV